MTGAASPTAAEAFEVYRENFETYRSAAEVVGFRISDALGAVGIAHRVSTRAKEPLSFYKKLMRKSYSDPFRECTDLSGVRVVVPLASMKDAAAKAIGEDPFLIVDRVEDARLSADPRLLRYAGLHLFITMKELVDHRGKTLNVEVQLKTEIENSWGDIEHKYIYKKPYAVPSSIERKFERLLVLIELFDQELQGGVEAMRDVDDFKRYELGAALEQVMHRLTDGVGDDFLTALNLMTLVPDVNEIPRDLDLVRALVHNERSTLASFYHDHGPKGPDFNIDRDWFFTQPELLLAIAMLREDPFVLRSRVLNTDLFEPVRDVASMLGIEGFVD